MLADGKPSAQVPRGSSGEMPERSSATIAVLLLPSLMAWILAP